MRVNTSLMKIRTLEDLNQEIDRDLAWRRKEISVFSQQVTKSSGSAVDVFVRAGVALVYAHWEGFIKHCAQCYVSFVGVRRLSTSELATPFVGQALQKAFAKMGNTSRAADINGIVESIFRTPDQHCPVPWKDKVNTRSNLSSEVLEDIVSSLGLDYSQFESRAHVVDEQLLGQRNKIAHGQYLDVDREHFLELKNKVIALMEQFRTQIENAAVTSSYRKSKVEASG